MSKNSSNFDDCFIPNISYYLEKNKNFKIGYRHSKGSKTPLVFLHGYNGNSKSWGFQFNHFAKNHEMIAIDFPGFGKSDTFPFTMESFSKVCNNLLISIDIKNFVLIGQSMGGQLAQIIAKNYESKIKGLVLCCTHTGYAKKPSDPLPESRLIRIEERTKLSDKDYGNLRIQKMLPNLDDVNLFNFLSKIASEVTVEGVKNGALAMNTLDTTEFLSNLNIPCLSITSSNDIVVPISKSNKLNNLIKNNDHFEMKGVGHAPYCENYKEFNSKLEKFIKNL